MELVDLAEPTPYVAEVDGEVPNDAGAKLAGGLPTITALAGRDQSGKVRLLVANPQDVTVTVDIAGLLRSGQIESSDKTTITITSLTKESLTKDTRDLVSSSEAEAGTLGAAELEPFSVQVYELQG
jgi:hypothetical protein